MGRGFESHPPYPVMSRDIVDARTLRSGALFVLVGPLGAPVAPSCTSNATLATTNPSLNRAIPVRSHVRRLRSLASSSRVRGRRGQDHRFCPRTEVVKQLLHRLLPDQQRHKVPDRSALEVRPEALNQDFHLIDRHRWKLDVEFAFDRSLEVSFVRRSALQRDPGARVISLNRHGSRPSPRRRNRREPAAPPRHRQLAHRDPFNNEGADPEPHHPMCRRATLALYPGMFSGLRLLESHVPNSLAGPQP